MNEMNQSTCKGHSDSQNNHHRHSSNYVDTNTSNNTNHNNYFTTNIFSNFNFASTIRRRFNEAYYKSLDIQKRPRLVKKCGELNIHMNNVPKHKRRLLSDFFNTILDMKWRWHVVIFLLSFIISWLLFATVWYMIAYLHGDLKNNFVITEEASDSDNELAHNSSSISLDDFVAATSNSTFDMVNNRYRRELDHLDEDQLKALTRNNALPPEILTNALKAAQIRKRNETIAKLLNMLGKNDAEFRRVNEKEKKKKKPCVYGVHDFTSALLYSVETQHTIGYGLRHITEECSFAIVFLMIQSCFGIFVQGLVAGVVFAKISRPIKRKRTIIFSHNAVVSERDGKLCFIFKIANIRITQLSDARIKLLMIKSRRTSEGEFIPFQSYLMKVGNDRVENASVFFPWPKTIEHIIDEESPLYEICKGAAIFNGDSKSSPNKKSHISEDPSELIDFPDTQANTLTTMTNSNGKNSHNDNNQNNTEDYSMKHQLKNEDYEIVVILEGNIETTGASCHIRTSYLPQEILFGYRFQPIYPKFTEFEYLFDYSKFDQVEPFQYDIMHLNVAHLNPHLNHVYDAKHEDKNLQLTFQNTIQKNDIKRSKPIASLASILSAFKAQSSNKFTSENENKSSSNSNSTNSNLSNLFDVNKKGKTSDENILNDTGNKQQTKGNQQDTLDGLFVNTPQYGVPITTLNPKVMLLDCYNDDKKAPHEDKNIGRFTIVPVGFKGLAHPAVKSDDINGGLLVKSIATPANTLSPTNTNDSLLSSSYSDELVKFRSKKLSAPNTQLLASDNITINLNNSSINNHDSNHQSPKQVLFSLGKSKNGSTNPIDTNFYRNRTNSLPVQANLATLMSSALENNTKSRRSNRIKTNIDYYLNEHKHHFT